MGVPDTTDPMPGPRPPRSSGLPRMTAGGVAGDVVDDDL
jgi:hypothetical protein